MRELEHRYGKNVHLVQDTFLSSLLALLCSPKAKQPFLTDLVRLLYQALLSHLIGQEFPKRECSIPTRMQSLHKIEGILKHPMIDFKSTVITIDLARAGIVPSQLCYDILNQFFDPHRVRQDHVYIQRVSDAKGRVIGSHIGGYKIGGTIQNAIMLVPDPMGATGGSICQTMSLYKEQIPGKAQKWIALHLIVTPEYLMRVKKEFPSLVVYALRLDRGLSSKSILKSVPGTHWKEEKGLNQKHYIVPGAGGLGELLNNSFV